MATKRLNTDTRRKQITEAVRELIVRYGSEHLTIRRVAGEVGISEAAIYRHFKSKREILSIMLQTMDETLLREINQAQSKYNSSLQGMNSIMQNHISAIEQRRGVYFQVLAEIVSLGDQKLNQLAAEVITKYIDRLANLIEAGINSGELRKGTDPKVAATLLFGMLHGTVTLWAINDYNYNLATKYQPLWDIFQSIVINQKPTAVNN